MMIVFLAGSENDLLYTIRVMDDDIHGSSNITTSGDIDPVVPYIPCVWYAECGS